jgi:hypothetical protein
MRLSTVSVSSRPNGVWAQPMMQAVMEFSLAELWSPYGRLFVAFAGNHNPGNVRRQHLWFPAPLRSTSKMG